MKLSHILVVILVVFTLIVGISTAYTTSTGTVDIVKRFGRVIDEQAPGGPYFKIPFVDTVTTMNVQTTDNGVVVKGVTADQQTLDVLVAVQWSIAPKSQINIRDVESQAEGIVPQYVGDASQILVTYGSREQFDAAILDRRISKITTDFISTKKLEAIVRERSQFTNDIEVALTKTLEHYPIVIDGIQVISIKPSVDYMKAIEDKQIAEVKAMEAIEDAKRINTLAEANKQAKQKEAEAKAYGILQQFVSEAEGITTKANALKSAGDTYLELTRITQWDGKYPLVMSSEQGVAFGIGAEVGKSVLNGKVK